MTETTEIYFSKSWRLEVLDQGLAVSVSSRNSFPGLPFHVSSHGLSSVCAHEREVSFSLPLLLRPLTLSDKGPTFITSINLNYPLKALSPNTVTLGVRASTQECGGGGWTHHSGHSSLSAWPHCGQENSGQFSQEDSEKGSLSFESSSK